MQSIRVVVAATSAIMAITVVNSGTLNTFSEGGFAGESVGLTEGVEV